MIKETHTSKILWIFLPEFPGPQKNKLVVFVAQLSREILISTNKIIVFDKDQLNEGRGFDPHTGVFTAIARGIYTFSASIESTNCDVRGAIYRNNEQFAHIAGHFVDREGALGSATSYVHLDEGDRVWVQWMGELNGRVGHVRSQFAGHLLHEMDIWITDKQLDSVWYEQMLDLQMLQKFLEKLCNSNGQKSKIKCVCFVFKHYVTSIHVLCVRNVAPWTASFVLNITFPNKVFYRIDSK